MKRWLGLVATAVLWMTVIAGWCMVAVSLAWWAGSLWR